MASIKVQLDNLPEIGGTTKGIYLSYRLIRSILGDMQERESAGDTKVSFAEVVQEILSEHYRESMIMKPAA